MFQVGVAIYPKDGDREFEDLEEAEVFAIERSMADSDIFAVWDKEDGELLCLVYDGRVYEG